jgi:hypothetical protein
MPAPADEPPQPQERYGPLVVRRMVKADGRALIRFDRAVLATEPGVGGAEPAAAGDDPQ